MLYPKLEEKIAALKERQRLRFEKRAAVRAAKRGKVKRVPCTSVKLKKPRRRRDPLGNAIRLLRWRLRKAIAAGTLAPDTDITNETLRREILRKRHARNSIRSWRRKAKLARSERWFAIRMATAERRAGIEQRKAKRAVRRQQEEQFRRELQIAKPKNKRELDIDQRIAAAFAEGFQAGKQFAQET